MNQGVLVILSGFSGSGKGTIVKELLDRYPDEFSLSISATTRKPREGEQDGREYFFKTDEEFKEMIENDELLEYAQYVNHYYGTPKKYVMDCLKKGRNVILEIEIQGALKIKEQFPQVLLLFVTPPSADELKNRLIGRNTESEEVIHSRLKRAYEEADGCEFYDYLVINDDLDTCVDQVYNLIQCAKHRMSLNIRTVETIKKQLQEFAKGES